MGAIRGPTHSVCVFLAPSFSAKALTRVTAHACRTCAGLSAPGGVVSGGGGCVCVRVFSGACACVCACAFVCAGALAVERIPPAAPCYSCLRACYICLRSGCGSDGNVYNMLRGLREKVWPIRGGGEGKPPHQYTLPMRSSAPGWFVRSFGR